MIICSECFERRTRANSAGRLLCQTWPGRASCRVSSHNSPKGYVIVRFTKEGTAAQGQSGVCPKSQNQQVTKVNPHLQGCKGVCSWMRKEQHWWVVGSVLGRPIQPQVHPAQLCDSGLRFCCERGRALNDQWGSAKRSSVQVSSQGKIGLNYCRWPKLFSQSFLFAELKQ